jgi:hypothetical protein
MQIVSWAPLIESQDKQGREWEVVIIEAGKSGNGFYYPHQVLKQALPLFDGVRALARSDEQHIKDINKNVKNIVGWFSEPHLVDNTVRARFHVSEAADWLRVLMLDAWRRGKRDIVGFSIVAQGISRIVRQAQGLIKWVDRIQRVDSVDVVVNPAAGGRIASLVAGNGSNTKEEEIMVEKMLEFIEQKTPDLYGRLDLQNIDQQQVLKLYTEAVSRQGSSAPAGLETRLVQLEDELKATRQQLKLAETLNESGLPPLAKQKISRRFSSEVFSVSQLREAIQEERDFMARLSESHKVRGAGATKFEVGLGERERTLRALDGFFANRDIDGVSRFRSFREAYVSITGDNGLSGQLRDARNLTKFAESLTSSSWAEILGESITRRMLAEYNAPGLGDWRKIVSDITSVRDFRTNRRMRIGGYGTLPAVTEAASYQNLTSPGDEEATFTIGKKGGLEDLTLEMIANDDVGAIRRIPQKLGRSAARTLYKTIFDIIVDNNVTSYDAVALFDALHGNLDTQALSANSLLSAKIAITEQAAYGDSADILGLTARWLLVPLELEDIAYRLTSSGTVVGATNSAGTEPNIHSSYGLGVIVVPYWTDANDWALVCDPADCPTIEVGFFNGNEEPELFVQDQPTAGSMFTQDKITYKIRHIYGICVLDHRGMYKSVVA